MSRPTRLSKRPGSSRAAAADRSPSGKPQTSGLVLRRSSAPPTPARCSGRPCWAACRLERVALRSRPAATWLQSGHRRRELLFVAGPLLAGLVAGVATPPLGVVIGAGLVLAGTLAFVSAAPVRTLSRSQAIIVPRQRSGIGLGVVQPVAAALGMGAFLGRWSCSLWRSPSSTTTLRRWPGAARRSRLGVLAAAVVLILRLSTTAAAHASYR